MGRKSGTLTEAIAVITGNVDSGFFFVCLRHLARATEDQAVPQEESWATEYLPHPGTYLPLCFADYCWPGFPASQINRLVGVCVAFTSIVIVGGRGHAS